MSPLSQRRFWPSFGGVMLFVLMGLLVLSALLYYKAVKIQRFSEPALALSQPRMEFGQRVIGLFATHFEARGISGIRFTTDSIYIDESLLLLVSPISDATPPPVIRELSKTLLEILENPEIRSYIDFILISSIRLVPPGRSLSGAERQILQNNSEFILKSLFLVEPKLEKQYSSYFAATVKSSRKSNQENNTIEFRFVPTERLHIDFLSRLQKYAE
jgi:hypothetical protein